MPGSNRQSVWLPRPRIELTNRGVFRFWRASDCHYPSGLQSAGSLPKHTLLRLIEGRTLKAHQGPELWLA